MDKSMVSSSAWFNCTFDNFHPENLMTGQCITWTSDGLHLIVVPRNALPRWTAAANEDLPFIFIGLLIYSAMLLIFRSTTKKISLPFWESSQPNSVKLIRLFWESPGPVSRALLGSNIVWSSSDTSIYISFQMNWKEEGKYCLLLLQAVQYE